MFLNCHSYHSLRYGTISIEDLVQQATHMKLKTLALTDINTVTGIYDFYRLCQENSIKPLIGIDIRVNNDLRYICLAKNFEGLGEVNRLLTAYNCEGKEIPQVNPDLKYNFVIYPLSNIPEYLQDHEFIGVRADELNLLIKPELRKRIDKMIILHPVTFTTAKEYELHKLLRAIDANTLISKLTTENYCQPNETFMDKKNAFRKVQTLSPDY